ncbi:MAG: beta-galactosidase [bacterium]
MRRKRYPCILFVWLLLSTEFPFVAYGQRADIHFVSWGGIGSIERVEAAAKIGIDAHRLPIGWPDEMGNYDFSNFDKMIIALHKAGIKVIIHFFNHGVPSWFWQRHPDAKPRNAVGESRDSFASPWNPFVLKQVKENMRKVLRHLKKTNLLSLVDGVEIGVGMEGQLSYEWDAFWAFDPYAIKAYRAFLKRYFHNDISKLNKEWSARYADFNQIYPPKEWAYTKECFLFEQFYRESIYKVAEELSNVVLEYFKPRIWYWMSHFIKYPERYYAARFPLYYMRKLRALNRADAVQISVVPGWQSREEVEKLKEMGLAVIGEIYITPTPQEQREHARLAWELGCDGFFVGTLENLFDEKGALTPTGKETEEIIKEWKNGGVK